jgi:hypothetical protein
MVSNGVTDNIISCRWKDRLINKIQATISKIVNWYTAYI